MNLRIKSIIVISINIFNNNCNRINTYNILLWSSIISIKYNNTMVSKIITKSKINIIYTVNKFLYFIPYLIINFCFYNKF